MTGIRNNIEDLDVFKVNIEYRCTTLMDQTARILYPNELSSLIEKYVFTPAKVTIKKEGVVADWDTSQQTIRAQYFVRANSIEDRRYAKTIKEDIKSGLKELAARIIYEFPSPITYFVDILNSKELEYYLGQRKT